MSFHQFRPDHPGDAVTPEEMHRRMTSFPTFYGSAAWESWQDYAHAAHEAWFDRGRV